MAKRHTTNARRKRLLSEVLERLIDGRDINWEVVRQLQLPGYNSDTFASDQQWIKRTIELFKDVFEPLGLALPTPRRTSSSFSLPTRPFARYFNSPFAGQRKNVAKAALAYVDANKRDLIPRSGSTYIGFGSQMYYLAVEIASSSDNFQNKFSTNSFEIAALFYLAGPHILKHDFYLTGSQLLVNDGLLVPHERPLQYETTIISVDSIHEGEMYTSQSNAGRYAEQAMQNTLNRVIVLVDHSKIHRTSGGEKLDIPLDKKIQLVTDQPLPADFSLRPNWEQPIVLLKPST